jgi:phosphohistidine phosphatase
MTTIYLMRHGYAEPGSAAGDAARRLTEEGAEKVRAMGATLAHADVQPDHLYCSPRVRARQTAELVGAAVGVSLEVRESVNFDFDVRVVYAALEETPGKDIMFVGHEPTMSATVYALTGAAVVMHPGTVVAIQMGELEGAILWMLSPLLGGALGGSGS